MSFDNTSPASSSRSGGNSPVLAFYGDDFTGSTDVMEVLQWAGWNTVLFLQPPTQEELNRFPDLKAFGIAGGSRTMSPEDMDRTLPAVFQALKNSGAKLVHYKMCSTFDSSPEIGSIGRAIEIGKSVFGNPTIPLMVGAPQLGRYVVFGNLFARSGLDTEPYRLDRHPTMRQHPITPMSEADLPQHLAKQTGLPVALCDVLTLENALAENSPLAVGPAGGPAQILLFDVLRESHLQVIGSQLAAWMEQQASLFCAGSSGIEYALMAWWEKDRVTVERPVFDAVEQIVVVTGSCSPVNDRQIAHALEHGFEEIALHPDRLIDPGACNQEMERVVSVCLKRLETGASVILHSSRGPDDPRIAATLKRYAELGFSDRDVRLKNGQTLGPKLGRILSNILEQHPMKRAAVAGGDTSLFVARELGIRALTALAPVAPGSPLCRVHSENALDGMELIFKGGQVGRNDVWQSILNGTPSQQPTTTH